MKNFGYILFSSLLFLSCQNSKKNIVSEENIVDKENVITDTLIQKVPEYEKVQINYEKQDTLSKVSKPFLINDIKCYWKLTFVVYEGDKYGNGILELKNENTHKTVLICSDIFSFDDSYYTHSFNNIDFESLNMDYVEDLNFDGYKDFKFFDKTASGSAGMYYRAYIFNRKKNAFEFIEDVSGYELTVNEKDRTLSTWVKNGAGWNLQEIHYFGKNGKMRYTEIIENEVILIDSKSLLKTTYKKVVDGKTVKTEIDITKFEGY